MPATKGCRAWAARRARPLTVDVSPDQPLQHGGLFVLRVSGNLLVKCVEQRLQGLVLHNDNLRYNSRAFGRADLEQFRIVSRILLVTVPPR